MTGLLTVLGVEPLLRATLKVAFVLALLGALAMAFALSSLASLVALPAGSPAHGAAAPPAVTGRPAPSLAVAGSAALVRPDLAAQPALNQYAPANYSSSAAWARWKDASCSAASLAWLLRAYGVWVGSIDQAVALIGDGTGISTQLGLLDASGRPLARAISRVGLTPRNANIGRSPAALQAWLDAGPLALDGAAWFGWGHWFIAYGYDANGVFTRDSSGHDVRYLTWAQLYGHPAGFSGNAVGIVAGR